MFRKLWEFSPMNSLTGGPGHLGRESARPLRMQAAGLYQVGRLHEVEKLCNRVFSVGKENFGALRLIGMLEVQRAILHRPIDCRLRLSTLSRARPKLINVGILRSSEPPRLSTSRA